MKAIVLYRPNSENARAVEEFNHEFVRRYPELRLEIVNVDGREGSATASLYDLTSHPAVLALRDDGSASQVWQGLPLPLLEEVAGYVRS